MQRPGNRRAFAYPGATRKNPPGPVLSEAATMSEPSPTVERVFNVAMGVLLTGCGVWVLLSPSVDLLRGAGAVLLLLFGVQALLSAWRRRRSWLSRLGPLP
jgi:threonine/homoserine/homoserine lactone efflux protein